MVNRIEIIGVNSGKKFRVNNMFSEMVVETLHDVDETAISMRREGKETRVMFIDKKDIIALRDFLNEALTGEF